jgi:hypothetical protein
VKDWAEDSYEAANSFFANQIVAETDQSTVDGEDVALAEQQIRLVADFEFITGIRTENYVIAWLDRQGDLLAAAPDMPFPDGDDIASLRFVCC